MKLHILQEGQWILVDPTTMLNPPQPIGSEMVRYLLANGEWIELMFDKVIEGTFKFNPELNVWKPNGYFEAGELVLTILPSKHIIIHPLAVETVVAPIRRISVGSFRRRFTLAEKIAIKISQDPVVQVISEDLALSTYVDLDSTQLLEGLSYLITAGILQEARLEGLLGDGTTDEL